MTTEVTCSGCLQLVPWPQTSVSTAVTWLGEEGNLRRVEMRNLSTGEVFHVCSQGETPGGAGRVTHGAERSEPVADLGPIYGPPAQIDRDYGWWCRPAPGQTVPGVEQAVVGSV